MLAALTACLACLFVPTLATARSDGGLTYGSADAEPVQGESGTLVVRSAAILGRALRVKGTMAAGLAGRPVTIQRQTKDGGWVATADATTTQDGAFEATWTTDHIGRFLLRAVPDLTPGASAAAAPSTGVAQVTVYRAAVATFFGPGFFGKQTACGQVLRTTTLGVAHRSLPCGTMVALYYRGAGITVPVIDRGPFRAHTEWDLTAATAEALHFTDTGTIGALRLPAADAPAAAKK